VICRSPLPPFFGFTIAISLWLARYDPALLNERTRGTAAFEKGWDQALIAFIGLMFFGWLVLMPLDAVRFQWSQMPASLQVTGALVLLASFYVLYRTFRENTFLSQGVRIQSERSHTVVSTGPYGVVRHPMYAGAALLFLGTALLLGSWYGVLGALLLTVLVGLRAVLEERALREELPGYDAYTGRVRYRLIPRVW